MNNFIVIKRIVHDFNLYEDTVVGEFPTASEAVRCAKEQKADKVGLIQTAYVFEKVLAVDLT